MFFLDKEFDSFDNLFNTLTSDPFFLKIKKDQENNLCLITHTKKTPINNFTRKCFGIIVDMTTLKPISYAFNKMWEITGKHSEEEIHQLIASHEFFIKMGCGKRQPRIQLMHTMLTGTILNHLEKCLTNVQSVWTTLL
jgi:hypothetical protein